MCAWLLQCWRRSAESEDENRPGHEYDPEFGDGSRPQSPPLKTGRVKPRKSGSKASDPIGSRSELPSFFLSAMDGCKEEILRGETRPTWAILRPKDPPGNSPRPRPSPAYRDETATAACYCCWFFPSALIKEQVLLQASKFSFLVFSFLCICLPWGEKKVFVLIHSWSNIKTLNTPSLVSKALKESGARQVLGSSTTHD